MRDIILCFRTKINKKTLKEEREECYFEIKESLHGACPKCHSMIWYAGNDPKLLDHIGKEKVLLSEDGKAGELYHIDCISHHQVKKAKLAYLYIHGGIPLKDLHDYVFFKEFKELQKSRAKRKAQLVMEQKKKEKIS